MTNQGTTSRSPGRTVASVAALLLGLVSIVLLLWLLVSPRRQASQAPAAPPGLSLEERRAADQRLLTTYGWVDQPKGIVRIPIDLAMEKVIAESRQRAQQP